MRQQLVLSLFPGIGLLDMAFEQEGFCVVRGPDVLWGGDVRKTDWLKTFCRQRRTEKQKYVLDGFSPDFVLVFDCEDDPETTEAATTCDILIERTPHTAPAGEHVASRFRIVANANKHGVMRMLAAIGIREFPDHVKKAFYELANPLRCQTEAISVPVVHRPATGRTIPDLRGMEHVCNFQREIKPQ